jgi:F-type H+-transporting ATPase subunit delta
MSVAKVSTKYAASFLDVVVEKNLLDTVTGEVIAIIDIMDKNPLLKRMFENPVVKPEVKAGIIKEIFSSKVSIEVFEFMTFILKKSREDILYQVLKRFLELKDIHLGIVRVALTTPFEFTKEQLGKLKTKLEEMLHKEIIFSVKIDSTLIGGFIANFGDTIIDASVKNQLDKLRKQFLRTGISFN